MQAIEFATWNIHGGWRTDGGRMSASDLTVALFQTEALMVGIQEAPSKDGVLSNEVAEALCTAGFSEQRVFATCPSHLEPGKELTLVLASKAPLSSAHRHLLPGIELDPREAPTGELVHTKGVLHCQSDTSLGGFDIFVLHLAPYHRFGLDVKDDRVQHQVRGAISVIRRSRRRNARTVVLGDFNLEDRSEFERQLGLLTSFSGRPTRPNGRSHDDIMFSGEASIASRQTIVTQSDHHLVSVGLVTSGFAGTDV